MVKVRIEVGSEKFESELPKGVGGKFLRDIRHWVRWWVYRETAAVREVAAFWAIGAVQNLDLPKGVGFDVEEIAVKLASQHGAVEPLVLAKALDRLEKSGVMARDSRGRWVRLE